ncbi:MAG TPA: RNA polymerase sigma factor [Lacunisphaera sp.]
MTLTPDQHLRFKSWLEDHRGILVKVIRSFAPVAADAADLQQELLLQLWLSLPSFAEQAKPSTWIYRVCLNTALTWRRGTSRREKHLAPEAEITQLPSDQASPAERVADGELLEKLYSAIRLLPASDRAFILLSLDGLTYREIADITGLTENHVGVALTRARKRLAERLKGVTHELE